MAACRVVVHRTRKPLNEPSIRANCSHRSAALSPQVCAPVTVWENAPQPRLSSRNTLVVGAAS
jgi:hypothetical protein